MCQSEVCCVFAVNVYLSSKSRNGFGDVYMYIHILLVIFTV